MIDVHCHLEQEEYEKNRNEIIRKCMEEGLKGIITCCAHPDDLELTLELVKKYPMFIFATVSLHPEYIKDFDDSSVDEYFERISSVKNLIVGIGETGLDYFWVKEDEWREKQKQLFIKHLMLAEKLRKPIIVHSRNAFDDTIEILETYNVKRVHWHMFGAHHLWRRVVDNGWYISLGPIIQRSKKHRKIARDCPLENILTETDSPWFGNGKRGTPLNVIKVVEKIAEIKKLSVEEVASVTTKNAIVFFNLPID